MNQSFKTNQPEASPHADAEATPQAASLEANANQRRAITTVEGPVLIIAGPGSGKTFTLVERVVYLIEHKQVSPENMLIVTFTDKAAAELTTRISNRLAQIVVKFNLNEMPSGTFHSLCLRWLEEAKQRFAKDMATASGMTYKVIKGSEVEANKALHQFFS